MEEVDLQAELRDLVVLLLEKSTEAGIGVWKAANTAQLKWRRNDSLGRQGEVWRMEGKGEREEARAAEIPRRRKRGERGQSGWMDG
eukprot:1279741-Rhodomonas_salina.1